MFSLLNWLQVDLKLYDGFCSSKMSFIISGAIPLFTIPLFQISYYFRKIGVPNLSSLFIASNNFFIFNQGYFFTGCHLVRQKWFYSFPKPFIVGNIFSVKTTVIRFSKQRSATISLFCPRTRVLIFFLPALSEICS